MNKRLFRSVFAVAVVAVGVSFNYHQYGNNEKKNQNLLLSENIEALSWCDGTLTATKGLFTLMKISIVCDGEGTCSKTESGLTVSCDGKEKK